MISYFYGQFDYWQEEFKISWDIKNKLMIVNDDVATLDVQQDIYSATKRWMLLSVDNRRRRPGIRTIGGDPTVQGQKAGDIYFLQNGWKLSIDLTTTALIGSLFSDDFDSPLIDKDTGRAVYSNLVSSLVTGVDLEAVSAPTAAENAAAVAAEVAPLIPTANENATATAAQVPSAVWDALVTDFLNTNSFGEYVRKQLFTKNDYYGNE